MENSEYGALSEVVAIAGSIMAAGYAISLAWLRRASWTPPEEDLPGSTVRVAALLASVLVVILYVYGRNELGRGDLAIIAGIGIVITLASLLATVYLNTGYSFVKDERTTGGSRDAVRVLGGFSLTEEAASARLRFKKTPQQLYAASGYDADLVWTRPSRALLKVLSTATYLVLQCVGTVTLSAAALLLSLFA